MYLRYLPIYLGAQVAVLRVMNQLYFPTHHQVRCQKASFVALEPDRPQRYPMISLEWAVDLKFLLREATSLPAAPFHCH